jgi:hypothetical protein
MPNLITRPFNALGLQMLDDLPPFMEDDPHVQAIIHAQSREIQRILDQLGWMIKQFFPAKADPPGLAIWEAVLGLTINPTDLDLAGRRAVILANIAKSHSTASGADWNAGVNILVGPGYAYYESNVLNPGSFPPLYEIIVYLPFPSNTTAFARAQDLIIALTPAHIKINFSSVTGLLLDTGALDVDTLG